MSSRLKHECKLGLRAHTHTTRASCIRASDVQFYEFYVEEPDYWKILGFGNVGFRARVFSGSMLQHRATTALDRKLRASGLRSPDPLVKAGQEQQHAS